MEHQPTSVSVVRPRVSLTLLEIDWHVTLAGPSPPREMNWMLVVLKSDCSAMHQQDTLPFRSDGYLSELRALGGAPEAFLPHYKILTNQRPRPREAPPRV